MLKKKCYAREGPRSVMCGVYQKVDVWMFAASLPVTYVASGHQSIISAVTAFCYKFAALACNGNPFSKLRQIAKPRFAKVYADIHGRLGRCTSNEGKRAEQ
jgi:hypothetical protein